MQTRTHHLLERAAALYGFPAQSVQLIRSSPFSPNDVYRMEKDGAAYILRIARHDKEHVGQTLAEMEWLAFLKGHDVPVSMPLRAADGSLAASIHQEDRYYTLCAFEMAPGDHCDKGAPSTVDGRIFAEWGRVMGRMHRVTKRYRPQRHGPLRPAFDGEEGLNPSLRAFPAIDALARALVESLLSLPRDRETYGLIHNDFHQGNFFVHEDRVHVFDFDDSMYGYFAQDIGIALYHAIGWATAGQESWCQSVAERIVRSFMAGYAAENSLSGEARAAIPSFMRYRQLCDFGWAVDPLENPMPAEQHNLLHGITHEGCRLEAALFL